MRRYSETVTAKVVRLMGPPQQQSVAHSSQEFGIHAATFYNWRHSWRLHGEVVQASAKDPDGLERCRKIHPRSGER
jgi:transposase-like protein